MMRLYKEFKRMRVRIGEEIDEEKWSAENEENWWCGGMNERMIELGILGIGMRLNEDFEMEWGVWMRRDFWGDF